MTIDRLTAALADRYTIDRELGQGGMATVYLAEDLKHHRQVAIKLLHAELSAILGPERFLKEIELTASLQHPHILPLFDSGNADGLLFYVMPYVDGETLHGRLQREQQLPITDCIRIATEVADALEYAHKRGVVHRDIKPENILLHNGHALVADFGIALAVQQAGGQRMTQTGLSLGTPQYMSPEQAMGEREIGPRSDLYSLGAVTYEMLAGEPPFTGPSAQAIVAQVITAEPVSLITKRKSVPAHVDDAVLTALEKLPADRFGSAAEFAGALAAPGPPSLRRRTGSASGRAPRGTFDPLRWTWIPAAMIAAAGAWWLTRHDMTPEPSVSASLMTAGDCGVAPVNSVNLIQLSPDGSKMVYIGECNGASTLWVRTIASGAAHALAGTTNPFYPFWSPDGRSVGFFANGRLKRIDLASGAVRDLAAAPDGRGGSWSTSGDIVYAPDIFGPLYRVPGVGGTPTVATALPRSSRVTDRMPYFLPDGRHFLFIEGAGLPWGGAVLAGTLGSRTTQRILDVPSNVAFAQGRLFYVRDGALFAQPFTPNRLRFTGPAVAVANNLETWPFRDLGNFTVQDRLLIYRPATDVRRRIDWFDPRTRVITPAVPVGPYQSIRLSPDGRTLLLDRNAPDSPLVDAWSYRLDSRQWTQLTTHPEVYYSLAWSRDSKFISVQGSSDSMVHVRPVEQGDSATYGPGNAGGELIVDWAPGDSVAVGTRQVAATGFDLMRLVLKPHAQPELFLATTADEESPLIDPSGTLIGYLSDQGGQTQAYVTTFPLPSEQHAISQDGVELGLSDVASPLAWAPDGHSLYVLENAQRLTSVKISRSPAITIDSLRPVDGAPRDILGIAAAPDGRLLLLYADVAAVVPFTVITNWLAAVR